MSDDVRFPVLSLAERDRRFALARQFMEERDLDVFILTGSDTRIGHLWTTNQHYLSNMSDAVLVFFRDSDPVLLLERLDLVRVHTEAREGIEHWVSDCRLSEPLVEQIAQIVCERNLQSGRAGVITAAGQGGFGSLADPLWAAIQAALPQLHAEDVARSFTIATLPRSEEELVLARTAAAAGEAAASALVGLAGAGVSELELYAAAVEQFALAGVDWRFTLIVAGSDVTGFGLPRWVTPSRPPRRLEPGDMVIAEFFPTYGGVDTQLHLSVHVGEPSASLLDLFDVADESYRAGIGAIRPGVRFESVWRAMQEPIVAAGCWDVSPLVHSMPLSLIGASCVNLAARDDVDEAIRGLPQDPASETGNEVVLEEGMLFAVEPLPGRGDDRAFIGSTVAVTDDGCEEFSTYGTRLHIVD